MLDALQLIPAGLLVTCPAPLPASATVRDSVSVEKVADTFSAAIIVTVHVPTPLHPAPFHPEKIDPAAGAADSTTWVPCPKLAAQVAPQLIPDGLLVTMPAPVPPVVTDSMKLGIWLKVAVSVAAAFTVIWQGSMVPLQLPLDQPANTEPAAAVAVSLTCVPLL